MFTDLVSYSALAHRDEALAIELLELYRSWVREILPRHRGREIETVGDAFLVEFAGALAALNCALEIQSRFADHNAEAPEGRRMLLRIGIHLGDVEHKDGKLMGDGVNIASRIHGMAEPGGVCVSEDVYHVVRNRVGFSFQSLGQPHLKNIETSLELFRLALGAAPAAARPAVRRSMVVAAAAVAAISVAAVLVAVFWPESPEAPRAEPSVAVLPFANLSAERDSAYFTDGLHDTVIGHLARIRDLRVISRTSVMGYRDHQGNLRKIAAELGVNHIVEGSVQRAGGRLRVAAQLIETASDTHLWSNEYDRDLADVFAVQADIAQHVASAVRAQLTPQEKAQIERVPTHDQEAYDLYLRAVVVSRQQADERRAVEAIGWLDRAVTLDPDFALAYALRAFLHDTLYWFGWDPSDARRQLVARDVERAERTGPGLAETHVAKAQHLYHGARDYSGALRELERARQIAPGNGQVHFWLATIYRRQGRWAEADASYERSVRVDPLNELLLWEYSGTLTALRRYADVDRILARLESFAADKDAVRLARAQSHVLATGDLAAFEESLARISPGYDPRCSVSWARFDLMAMQREFDQAVAVVLACAEQAPFWTKESLAALASAFTGDAARTRKLAEAARTWFVKRLDDNPDHPQFASNWRLGLAWMLAVLKEPETARKELDRALELTPATKDALAGGHLMGWSAAVLGLLGDRDRALDLLEEAMSRPGPIPLHAHFLRLHPAFDPLRDDPRFRKLIAKHLPNESG